MRKSYKSSQLEIVTPFIKHFLFNLLTTVGCVNLLKKVIEYQQYLDRDEAKRIYGQRKQVVEPVIGNYKENLGFREFLTRGLKSVRNEFNLVCTAANLRKIWIFSNKNEINGRKSGNKWNFSL
mgnify:CR=1 FL=1